MKSEPIKMEPMGQQQQLSFTTSSLKTEPMDHSGNLQHSVTLPQRSLASKSASVSNSASGRNHHGTGKIGRRPAHLPKNLKHTDPTLPQGWVRKLKQRKHGKQAGRWDVYIYSPCGVKFASKKKLAQFIEKNTLPYDPDDFDFTPYGRHMEARAAAGHASGGSGGSAASRHNSSGSTGSDGTQAGSSPASISNYSPTHSSAYIPQSVGLVGQMGLMGGHGLASASSFSEFDTFKSQLDMKGPPNSVAPGPEFCATGLPYQHLGRGHHYPIVNKDLSSSSCSADYLSADMGDILGGNGGCNTSALYNGFATSCNTSNSSTASIAAAAAVAAVGAAMQPIRANIDPDGSKTRSATAIDLVNNSETANNNNSSQEMDTNSFSIGRAMSALQDDGEGGQYY